MAPLLRVGGWVPLPCGRMRREKWVNGHQTVTRGLGRGGLRLHVGARCEGGKLPCARLSGPLAPLAPRGQSRSLCVCGARCLEHPLPGTAGSPLASFRSLLSVKQLSCHTPLCCSALLHSTDISLSVCLPSVTLLEHELCQAGSVLFSLVFPVPRAALSSSVYVILNFISSHIQKKERKAK